MFPWGNTPTAPAQAYAVGDTVRSGASRGAVVSVAADKTTMGVVWTDSDGGVIIYPTDAEYLQKVFPWES